MKLLSIYLLAAFAVTTSLRAEDFKWSWQKGNAGEAAANKAASTPTVTEKKEGFKWSWEEREGKKETDSDAALPEEAAQAEKGVPAAKKDVGTSAGGVDGAAYRALVDENLRLRRKIAEAERTGAATKAENVRLSKEVGDLEARIGESVVKIRELRKEKDASSGNLDKVMELEGRLRVAEAEKARLSGELAAAQQRVSTTESRPPSVVAETEEVATVVQDASGPTPREGSDLFRELQKENALLKKKWVEVETKRRKAQKAIDGMAEKIAKAEKKAALAEQREKDLERQMKQSVTEDARGKKEVRMLLKRIPALEQELQEKKSEASEKASALAEQEKKFKALMLELERREDRLEKAERMHQILRQAREELRQVSDVEKRDMHFNMGCVYAREGKFRLAEREYLRALQVDPNDSGVHYNLGILYDDELNDKRRAIVHYRKYLKLNPHGNDVDEVKGWLMQLELN